jgi:hypothetical protein
LILPRGGNIDHALKPRLQPASTGEIVAMVDRALGKPRSKADFQTAPNWNVFAPSYRPAHDAGKPAFNH